MFSQDGPSIDAALKWATKRLSRSNIEGGWRDARLVLSKMLAYRVEYIISHPEHILSVSEFNQFSRAIERRALREPASRIFGEREFWSMPFKITPDTLDPRPDSETIVMAALEVLPPKQRNQSGRVLDLGTGSGCLLISLLKELPNFRGVGIDINSRALEVAKINARLNHVHDRALFCAASWARPLNPEKAKFEVIVSNPPYLSFRDMEELEPEVALHDPPLALKGGEDGLDCYRELLPMVKQLLTEEGIATFEVGFGQAQLVTTMAKNEGFVVRRVYKDLSGIERAVQIALPT